MITMSELPEPFNAISNTAKKQGWTPLACASNAGNVDKVAELLGSMHVDFDLDLDRRDYDGRTSIALAARNGHTDIVAQLLAHGADPNLRDLQQMAPLWHAARHGHAPVVRALLESRRLSDVNPRPLNPFWYQSETPLAIALKYDHRETAELLARADGIDPFVEVGPDREPYSTCSVLALAIRGGHEDVALILLENRDLEPRSPYVYVASSNKSCDSLGARSSNNDSVDAGSINNMREDTDDTGSNNSDSEDAASRIKDDSDYVGSINNMDRNSDATRSINSDSDDEAFGNSNDSDSVGSSNCPRNDSLRAESIDNSIDDARSEYNYSDNSDSGPSSSYLPKYTSQLASKLLVFAAGAGCYRVVQELLANHGADVNALHIYHDERKFALGGGRDVGHTTETPLFAAARRGHSSIVRLLLDTEGIQPDLRCSYVGSGGDTALGLAAEGGFVDIVRMLAADTRVEIDHKDQLGGRTPLSYAAEYGHEAVVAWLLETEAVDPDSQCSSGYTPLMRAASPSQSYVTIQWKAQEGVVRRLLASGRVNPNCTNNNGKSALSFMAECPSIRPITALLKHLGTDLDRGQWSMLLRSAAESGGADTVQMLLDAPPVGADAVKPSLEDDMYSALQLAASFGNESVVQVLLSRPGINPNGTGKSGETPLLMATRRDNAGVVKQLSNVVGINPNTQDDEGWTALCRASREGSTEILRVLVKIPGIDPNLANNLGRTALSLAAEAGSVEQVDILLAVDGIDPDAPDTDGRSPLSWAFKSHTVSPGYYSSQKTNDRKQVVRRLLALPAVDINAGDAEGLTPLLRAVKIDFSDEFVGLLLTRADLDVNRRGPDGVSPLALAKGAGNTITIALLQEHGAIASDEAVLSGRPETPLVDSDSSDRKGDMFWHSMNCAASSDSVLDRPIGLGERLGYKLRENVSREYCLTLGTQQEYVGKQAAETVDKLCSMCAAIDLDAAFSNRHTKYRGRVIADLGRVDKTWEERNCSFCRLLAAVRPLPGINGGHKLVSFSTTQSWLCHDQLRCWNDIKDSWVDTMVLAVVAGPVSEERIRAGFKARRNRYVPPDPNSVSLKVVQSALSAGLISRLGSNCPENKNAITVPRLTPYGSDSTMSMAKSWITRCRQSHSTRCNPRKLAPVPHFRLIECTARRIIRIEESTTAEPPKYVALSYVWGQPPPSQPQPHQPQGNPVEKVSATVEAVIEDAIRVALALGYEYLWVDRYCVAQTGNEAIKMEQLRHMHTVYANAEVTLVAAAGTNPSAGLPGAPGDSRRFQQPSAIVSGHALVCIPPDPTHHIRSASTWATRGWTFQEGLLARRRLFFSDHEISYECRDMLCREALRVPRSLERVMSGRVPRLMEPQWMYKPYKLPGMKSEDNGTALFDLLAAYSVRELSLPSDALNAMLGIFQLLGEKEHKPVYHICGVPILYRDAQSMRARYPPTPNGFIQGLCWRLQQPARRRQGFPSWSWTGWHGVVKSMHGFISPVTRDSRFDVDISIIPRGHDGGAVSWDSYYHQLSTADDSSKDLWSGQQHILEITACAATVRFRRKLEPVDDCGEWIGTVCSGDLVWQGEFSLTRRNHDEGSDRGTITSLHSALLEKSWAGIVLNSSQTEEYQTHNAYILVIREQENKQSPPSTHTYWERVGLLKLENCTLEEEMLERQTWRLA